MWDTHTEALGQNKRTKTNDDDDDKTTSCCLGFWPVGGRSVEGGRKGCKRLSVACGIQNRAAGAPSFWESPLSIEGLGQCHSAAGLPIVFVVGLALRWVWVLLVLPWWQGTTVTRVQPAATAAARAHETSQHTTDGLVWISVVHLDDDPPPHNSPHSPSHPHRSCPAAAGRGGRRSGHRRRRPRRRKRSKRRISTHSRT